MLSHIQCTTPTSATNPAEAVLEAFFAKRRTPAVVLQRFYPPAAFPRVRSRLGGLPQLPDGMDWPVGESYGEAAPMHFLARSIAPSCHAWIPICPRKACCSSSP